MTRLSKFSTRELQAEIAKRKKRTQEREYKKLCAQFPCPDCGADPVQVSTDMIEEHRFAPRDSEGFPMLYAPYEMGETHGATYRTTIVCGNGHTWFSEPVLKWFDKPFTGSPILGGKR